MFECTLLVLIVVAFINTETGEARHKDPYHVNVNINLDDQDESYPYIVIIGTRIAEQNLRYFNISRFDGDRESFMRDCFGSAISNYWVLTAAYCAQGPPEDKRIILDEAFESTKTTAYRHVLKNVVYDDYIISSERSFANNNLQVIVSNDIGLMVTEDLNLKEHGLLARFRYNYWTGKHVSYINHRKQTQLSSSNRRNPNKKFIYIEHGIAAECEEEDDALAFRYKWYFRLKPAICVVSENGLKQKVQRGTSGSPLLSDGKIIGIATGTHPLQFHYTPISPFLDWIDGNVFHSESHEESKIIKFF